MTYEFIFIALTVISVLTSLATEGIKKLLDEQKIKYAPNLLAAAVSVIFTIVASVCYIVYTGGAVTAQIIIECVVMVFLSFLIATVGYDKVIQAIGQIKKE
jgi:amino acid transporter